MTHHHLISVVLLAATPGAVAVGLCDAGSQTVRTREAQTDDSSPATLTSDDLAPEQATSSSELTQAEADRMLFWAVVSDARSLFQRNERKPGTANAARIAVAMVRRDRAVRSAVYNPTRRTLTVVLRSGFTGEASLMSRRSDDRF